MAGWTKRWRNHGYEVGHMKGLKEAGVDIQAVNGASLMGRGRGFRGTHLGTINFPKRPLKCQIILSKITPARKKADRVKHIVNRGSRGRFSVHWDAPVFGTSGTIYIPMNRETWDSNTACTCLGL